MALYSIISFLPLVKLLQLALDLFYYRNVFNIIFPLIFLLLLLRVAPLLAMCLSLFNSVQLDA